MKRLALGLVLSLLAATAAAQRDTSELVDASKEAKPKRKTSTTKVITNSDVKKSKGKLIVKPATTVEPVKEEATLAEKHEAERTARLDYEAKLKDVNERIAKHEAELAKLEQAYFEENDLTRRDEVIAKQFAETSVMLSEAKHLREMILRSAQDDSAPQ